MHVLPQPFDLNFMILYFSLALETIYMISCFKSFSLSLFLPLLQMDSQKFDNFICYEGLLTGLDQYEFSGFAHWRHWQLDFSVPEEEIIDAIPLMQRYPSEPLTPPQYLFDELNVVFDEENHGLWDDICADTSTKKRNAICDGEEMKRKEKRSCLRASGSREEKNITFEEVSKYFYMPITQAARELNIGLTLLKKKCRELGIPRWPHRKMKSLQTLIKNVQELERDEGEAGEAQLRLTIEMLEQEKKLMEEKPAMTLKEKTKKLRQSCFKANYKKRRQTTLLTAEGEGDDDHHSPSAAAAGYRYNGVLEYFH